MRSGVSVLDVAPTLAHRLGVPAPERSVGACLLCDGHLHADDEGSVTVVLPVHNEAPTVEGVIAAVPTAVDGRDVDVVVVDDGSTDGSADLALAAGAKVLTHERNEGLGAAVRTGLRHARQSDAWAAVFLDADGEYDPGQLAELIAPLARGDADYVVGSRFRGTITAMLPGRRIGNRVLTVVTSVLARKRISDGQSGFRALSRNALATVEIGHDYNYAQVLTLELMGRGYRYAEVPITYGRRVHGRSFVTLGRYLRKVLPAMVRAARTR
jgi:glycosyltransferase involved in cell wall biosynthesis